MADNLTLNAGTGGATLAADDIGGTHHQRVKIQYGADGSATDVSDASPLPVDDAGGSLTVDNAHLTALGGAISGTEVQVDIVASAAVPVTDNSGSLTVDNGGTFAVQVDGDALTALQLIDDAVYADDADWTDGTSKHLLVGGLYQSSEQSITDGDVGPLSVDVNGKLKVAEENSAAILADTAAMDTNLGTIAGAVSGSEMQVDVVAALPAGTNAIGKLAANDGVDIGDVDVTSISAGANLIGDVGLSGARTSGGTTLYKNIDVDESEDQVKGTAGQVYWIHAVNVGTAPRYLKIYNATAANVTVGTTTPDLTFPIPSQGDANGAGFTLSIPNGIAFSTAITIAATTGVADADSGAPGGNEVIVNLGYA